MGYKSEQYKRELIHKRVDAQYSVSVENDESAFQGYRIKKIEELKFPLILGKEPIIVDFGNHYTGYLHIELDNGDESHIADSPTNIVFDFAEMPIELMKQAVEAPNSLSLGWIQTDFKTIPFMPYSGSLERRYAFRYLRLKRVDSVIFPVKVKALYVDSVSSVDINNALSCNIKDPILKKIDEMCLNTLKECEQDVFEDGPKRDRRLWIGDLRLQALVDYESFRNIDLIKRCIYLFSEHLNNDGLVAPCVFPDTPPYVDQWIYIDYSLCFVLCLYDYYINTGDKDLISELYDIALHQIEYTAEHFDKDIGKIDLPFFIDHRNFDKTIASLGYFIYTLRKMIVLSEVVGADNSRLKNLLCDCEKSLMKFYSEDKGMFLAQDGEISWHSQIWAALSGIFDEKQTAELLKNTTVYDPEIKISTPFMKHYFLEALYSCKMTASAEKQIKEFWGAMLDVGFDCCPECFTPEDEFFTPYVNTVLNSACHAWSCTASYWIRKQCKGE